MIIAKNISYSTNGKQILYPMSFKVEPGIITVLLGANGAGKSTLLKLLAGERQPDSGNILLNDKILSAYSARSLAGKRAVLTQHYSVPLPFSCEEIVMMGRYPHEGLSTGEENRQIVLRCMKEMQVYHFAKRIFGTLSGGEQQRVQMARVLAQLASAKETGDRVLMLDEPTSSLDYLQQQLILSKARSLALQGYTIIIVLHDLNLASQYADNIFLLKKGRLLAEGGREDVLISSLISEAYDMDIDIVVHNDYPFPILIPALHNQKHIFQTSKINKHGIYNTHGISE